MKTLYVGNLPFQATEDDLRDWFANAGVTSPNVQIIRDRFSGNSRGFGFVEVGNDAEADEQRIDELGSLVRSSVREKISSLVAGR